MNREQGFTLIELLAAMTVGSLLLVGLVSISASFGQEIRRDDSRGATVAIARTQRLMTDLIASTLLDGGKPALSVEARSIEARVPPPQALGPVGPVQLRIAVERDDPGEKLVATMSAVDDANPLPPGLLKPTILLRHQRSIRFADPVAGGGKALMVAMRIEGFDRHIRDAAFLTRVDGDGSCRFDPISMACR